MKKLRLSEDLIKKTRNIPRNQYGRCLPEPLARYCFKYNFDRYCEAFFIEDKETGEVITVKGLLEVIYYLSKKGGLYTEGMPAEGLPIVEGGLVCYHKEEADPYFVCVITLDNITAPEETRTGNISTYFFKP